MTSTITAHKFAQMQHAEYEAQAARYPASTNVLKENKASLIASKIGTLIHQARESLLHYGNRQAAMSS